MCTCFQSKDQPPAHVNLTKEATLYKVSWKPMPWSSLSANFYLLCGMVISNSYLYMFVFVFYLCTTSASISNRGAPFLCVTLYSEFDSHIEWPEHSKNEKFGVLLNEWIGGGWRLSSASHTELSKVELSYSSKKCALVLLCNCSFLKLLSMTCNVTAWS